MAFRVSEIIDGQTITVIPRWRWTTPSGIVLRGYKVKIKGYNVLKNSHSSHYAFDKLQKLLSNKELVLKNAEEIEGETNIIACNVFVENVDISNYFPEYKNI